MKLPLTMERKLTLILLSLFFAMLLVMVVLLAGLRKQYDSRVYLINSENTRNILSRADSVFSGALLLGDLLVTDEFFQNSLSQLKDSSDESFEAGVSGDVTARLSTLIDTSLYIVDIALSTSDGLLHYGSGIGLSSDSMALAEEIARAENGAAAWVGSDEGDIFLVRTIRRLEFLSLDELAVLFIRIDADALAAAIRSEMSNAGICLVLTYGDRLLFSEFPAGADIPGPDETEAVVNSIPCFIYRGTLPGSGFSYLDAVPKEPLYGDMAQMVAASFVLFLLILVVFLLVLHHIAKRMMVRINALREKMDVFGRGGNLEDIRALPGSDEIAELNERFDMMARDYRAVVEDNYRRQLMLKDSEIRMLTQQINPHFLYNVLDSIYWLSQKYDADDIASMSYDLASLFRAAVSSEDLVPVRKELELLESFLGIQRSRFSSSISYEVHAEDQVLDVMIPKFSLQPLVENAVKHSVEEKGCSTAITVSCRREGDGVLLEVANTGSAFPRDIGEKLKDGRVSSSSERIGLQNIDERLHLLFGEGHGLVFRNEDGRAVVSFIVPGR